MNDAQSFGLIIAGCAGVGLAAILLNRVSERISVPAPAFFLVAASAAAQIWDDLGDLDPHDVERVVTVALALILFDGGLHIGYRRFRRVAAPVALLGVIGTFLTTAGVAALAHYALDFGWYPALLLGAAIAPTDPAVVFAVLGRREIAGRSGAVLEGESGANDPVGIALMTALIAAGGISGAALGDAAWEFARQMGIGMAGGLAGAAVLRWFLRSVSLPNEGLYPLRLLAGALTIFGLTAAANGSGFLAVFVAGIALGDLAVPYKRETERFMAALASLGEIVAFVMLGLTIDPDVLSRSDVWGPGLLLAVGLAVVIRPVLVGACLRPSALSGREQIFVLWAGLKGAVPILLGLLILVAHVADADRLYGIVVIVVVFSVVVQGATVGLAAGLLRIPMRRVDLMPYSLGVRLRHPATMAHPVTVVGGSVADGTPLDRLPEFGQDFWVSFVVREGHSLALRGETRLAPGDDVIVLAAPAEWARVRGLFVDAAPWTSES